MCGADIEKIEADSNLQGLVDRFIEGHARIKRSHNAEDNQDSTNDSNKNEDKNNKRVIYEDVSLERGAFLVQQAMRVSLCRLWFDFLVLHFLSCFAVFICWCCYILSNVQAFRAQNIESAKSRLSLCAEDIRGQLETMGNTSELCSQLGAVLGMLGDCWFVLPLHLFMYTHNECL